MTGADTLTLPDPDHCGFVAVRGGRIWYRLNGSRQFSAGRVPLLAIHGGPGMSHHYLSTLTDLAEERPVILYDQLDSGNSDRPGDPANWTVERFRSEIDALRDALGLDRVIVFGNSWGGTLAAEYAITRPAGLQRLILSSPLISTARWIADNTAYRKALPAEAQQTLDRHEAAGTTDTQDYDEAVTVFYKRHLCRTDPWPSAFMRTLGLLNLELYKTMWGNTEFNASGTLKDYDCSERLRQIDVPTLYTCGDFDEATPEACRDFAGLTPKAKAEVISDASHTAFLEQRETYVEVVRRFLAETA